MSRRATPGRPEAQRAVRGRSHGGDLPCSPGGADAADLLACARSRPAAACVDARDAADAELTAAGLHACSTARRSARDAGPVSRPVDRLAELRSRRVRTLPARARSSAARREDVVPSSGAPAMSVEVLAAVAGRARGDVARRPRRGRRGGRGVAATRRLRMGPDRSPGRRGRAALGRAAPAATLSGSADFERGAREASRPRLGELAAGSTPRVGWDDLVLPERQRDLLRAISAHCATATWCT